MIVLTRTARELAPEVQNGISAQQGVNLRVYRVIGEPRPQDASRWATIARARNRGKEKGTSAWLMFLDDDVVLEPGCVRKLVNALHQRPHYGALAADYLSERRSQGKQRHVAMGATLFRRSVLGLFQFRWEDERCECQCCCDDLRQQGVAIGYTASARARHLESSESQHHASSVGVNACTGDNELPVVLTAFDRRHYAKFRRQFLPSFRASGNRETVVVVCYGLLPSQQRILAKLPAVRVEAFPDRRGDAPARRRLYDFQTAIAELGGNTPVAYWDAGDVVFQDRITELWHEVRAKPSKLLVAREPIQHPENGSVAKWTLSIHDARSRQFAFDLLSTRPVLNGGFAAGTAETMRRYFRDALRLVHSPALSGTSNRGDQSALNLFCHSNASLWHEVDEGWNYCLFGREWDEIELRPDGRLLNRAGRVIQVVHGNAGSLRDTYDYLGAALPS